MDWAPDKSSWQRDSTQGVDTGYPEPMHHVLEKAIYPEINFQLGQSEVWVSSWNQDCVPPAHGYPHRSYVCTLSPHRSTGTNHIKSIRARELVTSKSITSCLRPSLSKMRRGSGVSRCVNRCEDLACQPDCVLCRPAH